MNVNARAGAIRTRVMDVAWEIWLPLVLIVVWWFASLASTSQYFPPLAEILDTLREDWFFTRFWSDLVPSLSNLFLGLIVGVALGILLGVVVGGSQYTWMAVGPLAHFMRALPTLALMPAAMSIFGIGAEQKIALVAFASFWPVFIGTLDGVRGVDFTLRDVARSYQLPVWKRLLLVVLPAASPNILAGARISLAIGVIMMVGAELYGATHGVGFYLIQSQRAYQLPQTWAATLLLGIIGYLLSLGFRGLERALLHWHPSVRSQKNV